MWLLTGIAPAYAPLVASRLIHSSELAATDRIVLTVDPSLPADVVAAFYRRVRGSRSGRALSARQARLAAFVAERPRESWGRRKSAWNALHGGQWRYSATSNMVRDAGLAKQRLLRPRRAGTWRGEGGL